MPRKKKDAGVVLVQPTEEPTNTIDMDTLAPIIPVEHPVSPTETPSNKRWVLKSHGWELE